MIALILCSFLPFASALLINSGLDIKRGLLIFPITLMTIHLFTGWRWQWVPAYAVVLSLILFGLWAVFPQGEKVVPFLQLLPGWVSVRCAIAAIIALSVILLSASIFLTWAFPGIIFPVPTGDFPVGTVLEAHEAGTFRIWYPAAPQPSGPHYPYLLNRRISGLSSFVYSHLQGKLTGAFINPSLASKPSAFPVVVYDHGANSFPEDNTFRLIELASHGFVVAAIAHPRAFEDYGISTQRAQEPSLFNERLASVVVPERVKDVRQVVQQLSRLNTQSGTFRNRLNLDSFGLLGYSLGGSVLSEYCLEDRRCTVVVNLDGGSFGKARQGVRAAFLQLSQSVLLPSEPVENPQNAMEKTGAYYRQEVSDLLRHTQATHPTYWLRMKGSGHAAFTDLVHWTPMRFGFFGTLMGKGDARAISQIINELTICFFNEYLQPVLNESASTFEGKIQEHSSLLETVELLGQ